MYFISKYELICNCSSLDVILVWNSELYVSYTLLHLLVVRT